MLGSRAYYKNIENGKNRIMSNVNPHRTGIVIVTVHMILGYAIGQKGEFYKEFARYQ